MVLPLALDVLGLFLEWTQTGRIHPASTLIHRIYPRTGCPEVPGQTGRKILIDVGGGMVESRGRSPWATPDDLAGMEMRCSIERGRDTFMIFVPEVPK